MCDSWNNAELFLKLFYIQSKEIENKKYYEENKLKGALSRYLATL